MSVVILFQHKEIGDWFKILKALLPDTKVEVYPEIENNDEVEFLVTWRPYENYINDFPNLKVVQSVGAGIDHLLHTLISDQVQVTRIVDPTLKQDMFEHVLSCVMAEMKNLLPYYKEQQQKVWKPQNYLSINQMTICILGLGEIGKLVAEKLVTLGFKVKGWSNSAKEINGVEAYFDEDGLAEAVKDANFVVNILPLTEATRGILNSDLFNLFTMPTTLINVGRGGHLNDADLILAIGDGQVKNAYLDVFHQEPLNEDHPFWVNDSIYITPHIASITNPETAILQVVDNYKRLKNNEVLQNIVDLKRGY